MQENPAQRGRKIVSRIISAIIASIGIYIILIITIYLFKRWKFDKPFYDIIFLLIFPIPAILVACYFLRVAFRTWSGVTGDNVGSIAIVTSIITFWMCIAVNLEYFGIPDISSDLVMILAMTASGISYLIVKKGLLVLFEIEDKLDYERHRKSTMLYFGVMAFLLYGFLTNLWWGDSGPRLIEVEEIRELWISAFITFGMIPVAWGFYKLGVKLFLKKPPEQLTCQQLQEEDSSKAVPD